MQGKNAESEKLYRELIEQERIVFGPEHRTTVIALINLTDILRMDQKYVEAEQLRRETLDIQRRTLGPNHEQVGDSLYSLARLAALQLRLDEALTTLREAVEHGLSPDASLGIEKEPDLQSLHGDPRFAAIVSRARARFQTAHASQ
jgi:hypothetical protein